MSVSTRLQIPQPTDSQSGKMATLVAAFTAMEQALCDKLTVDTSSATTGGDEIDLAFDDADDLSAREALRAVFVELTAGATANFVVNHPAAPHFFFVVNRTGYTATFQVDGGEGDSVSYATLDAGIIYTDGTDFYDLVRTRDYETYQGTLFDTEEASADFTLSDAQFWGGRTIYVDTTTDNVVVTITTGLTANGPVTFVNTGVNRIEFLADTGVTIISESGYINCSTQYAACTIIGTPTAETYLLAGGID